MFNPGEAGQEDAAQGGTAAEDDPPETTVYEASGHGSEQGRNNQGQRERPGQLGFRPAQVALPLQQQRGKQIVERRPDQRFRHRQRPYDPTEGHAVDAVSAVETG